MKLQNKKVSTTIKIWKNITMYDMPVILVILVTSITIGAFSFDINIFGKLMLIILLLLIQLPLLFTFTKHQAKGYVVLWRVISFKFRPKKYSSLKPNHAPTNTISLVPYQQIQEDFIKVFGGCFGALQIQGRDVSTQDENVIEVILQNFTQALNNINNKISIVKLPRKNDLTKNIQSLNSVQNDKYDDFYEHITDDILDNFTDNLKDNYFIVMYEKNPIELKEQLRKMQQNLFHSGLETRQLNLTELLNLAIEIMNPVSQFSKEEIEEIKQSKSIRKFFRQKSFRFTAKHFRIEDYFYSTQVVGEYPFHLPANWANQLFESDSVVVWHLKNMSTKEKQKRFHEASRNHELNIDEEKNRVLKSRNYYEAEALEEIIRIEAANLEAIFESTFLFLNRATDEKGLKELIKQNESNVKNMGGKINNLVYRQFEGLSSSYLKIHDQLKQFIEMPASNISYGWPFYQTNLNDENFNIIGNMFSDGSPVFFDQFKDNEHRKNNNLFILGTSGSGKSTLTKKLAIYNLLIGNEVYILDPQNEYAKTGKKLGANIIDIGSGAKTSFNPLQITKAFDPAKQSNDEDEFRAINLVDVNRSLLKIHEENFSSFLKLLFEDDIDSDDLRAIIRSLRALYKRWKLTENAKKDLSKLEPNKYPTFDDLMKEIQGQKFEHYSEQKKNNLLDKLDFEFGKHGKLRALFNAYSNFDFSNKFTIFNVAPLMQSKTSIYKSGFYLILNYIQGKISDNLNSSKKVVLIIDEAHKFIDENNSSTLDFIYSTAKTIRKFGGGLILTTQNPRDFSVKNFERKSEAIIDNCQYSIFFNLKSKDVEIVDQLYKNSGGLTNQEKQFITSAKIGEFLFAISANQRILVDSYYNQIEKQYYFDHGDKKQ